MNEMTGDLILKMEGVTKSFGDTKALSGLTFGVRRGEIFGFLGPSGAGKTTTMKLLTRQLKADSGAISLYGQPIASLKQSAFDGVGVLTDTSGLYERLTVGENLQLFADIHRLPKGVVAEALSQVDLADAKNKAGKHLSRGMKQRLMLARAILHKPTLLFLDEPTAALDPGTTQQIHKLLRELNQAGTTIFLTTHDMTEADRLCHRVAFLHHGGIVACDTPEALKLKYAKDEMTARTKGGKVYTLPKTADALLRLSEALSGDALLTLHTKEPNLEEIFLQLTGRDLS